MKTNFRKRGDEIMLPTSATLFQSRVKGHNNAPKACRIGWLVGALIFCLLTLTTSANEIVRGTTLTEGQQLYASDLHNLIDTATVGVGFYNDQQTTASLQTGFYFLLEDPGNQVYRRVTAQNVLYGNTNFWVFQTPSATIQSNALFNFYDPTNNNIRSITASNLFQYAAQWLGVQNLSFANSNGQYLATYPNASVDYGPTNALQLLVWDTNGVPKTMTGSNLWTTIYKPFYTNNGIQWWWTNTFAPWKIYATNSFTNAWGYYTNFPITNLFYTNSVLTNNSPTVSNIATLVDSDTFPVNAASQGTNTTATLLAFYQYLTNKNALPPYNLARVSFNGNPSSQAVTGGSTINDQFLATAHGMTGVKAVSWQFSGSSGTSLPTSPQVVSNICYYALTADANHFVLFTNYADAVNSNHPVTISGTVAASGNTLLYLNNFTTYNADAIQLCSGTSLSTAHYAICYRTNLADNLYYFTGGVQPAVGHLASGIECSVSTSLSVSNMFIDTFDTGNTGGIVQNRVWVLIQPQ